MAKIPAVLCLVLICMVVIAPHAEAIACPQVYGALSSCIGYVTGKVSRPPPTCCGGIRSVNSAAKTTADRQTVCRCLKSLSGSIRGIILGRVSGLPGICGVNVGYPISPNTDCSKVQ